MVRIGMLGCGFLATFYMQGLAEVPNQQVVTVYGRDKGKAAAFAQRWNIPESTDDMEAVAAREDVDLVIIALPNALHLPATRLIASHKKHIACTKPLARNAEEARQMLEAVQQAGIIHCYGETEVFSPAVIRAKSLIDEGSIGRILTVRSREAHAGPHAPHFWNAEEAGGGALLDMGCHTIEAARYFIGKDIKPVEVLAWGDTMVHTDKTTAEDNAIVLLRFENGAIGQTEVSWTARGSLDLRNEVYGTEGSIFTDVTRSTPINAFVRSTNAYLLEKAESNTGWIFPLPDEARVYGYHEEMKHFVECVAQGKQPRETFTDGLIINTIMDAAYRSMREHRWVPIEI
ncbi:Gfo/Idh/MocA family oxidoreductase [Ktedonosporobacter rubrisoli]|uniref:Gfo/Idh/MocA family oxidoreductase n=1 Tax=Ktedonosporobacter rubrisoli TaxID=2509675 RepID=A0A4P6JTG2_KTERU|nr:Gfo/Idh/MocA family oxidoreductase [Ktedonosporobacter rubrisoli]QBD78869.1 Gfo/Idh/MocA family oxidoreductase [Ktedonosporobacter rubrisoli]